MENKHAVGVWGYTTGLTHKVNMRRLGRKWDAVSKTKGSVDKGI